MISYCSSWRTLEMGIQLVSIIICIFKCGHMVVLGGANNNGPYFYVRPVVGIAMVVFGYDLIDDPVRTSIVPDGLNGLATFVVHSTIAMWQMLLPATFVFVSVIVNDFSFSFWNAFSKVPNVVRTVAIGKRPSSCDAKFEVAIA